jgi:hypothetical protein
MLKGIMEEQRVKRNNGLLGIKDFSLGLRIQSRLKYNFLDTFGHYFCLKPPKFVIFVHLTQLKKIIK